MYTAEDFKDPVKLARIIATGKEYPIVSVSEQNGNVTLNLQGYAEDGGNANVRVSAGEKIFVEPVVEEDDDFLSGETDDTNEEESEKPEVDLRSRWIAVGLPAETFEAMDAEAALVIVQRLEKPTSRPKKDWREGKLATYWRKGKFLTEAEFEEQFGFDGMELANEFVKIVSGANGSRKPKSGEVSTHLVDGLKVTIKRLEKLLSEVGSK